MKDGQILAQEAAQVVTPELVERVFAVPCRIIESGDGGSSGHPTPVIVVVFLDISNADQRVIKP